MTEEIKPLSFQRIAQKVASSIAPAWPLDQSVAVNPWWPQRHNDIEQTFAEQAVITGETGLMEKQYYRDLWNKQIKEEHVNFALRELNSTLTIEQLIEALHRNSTLSVRWKTLAMLMDEEFPSLQGHSWLQEIVQQVSQFIALYHQYPERFESDQKDGEHLYQSWLEVVSRDKGINTLLGVDLLDKFRSLPKTIGSLFDQLEQEWSVVSKNEEGTYAFMLASLHQLSGWAGWQSWLDWQSALGSHTSKLPHTLGLTAILLAWDTVLFELIKTNRQDKRHKILQTLRYQVTNVQHLYHLAKQHLAPIWVWQRALEFSTQSCWIEQISEVTLRKSPKTDRPELQAIFCIDVRSEPMRRALELQNPGIETLGFAGFFGIPIAYQTHNSSIFRPQLPGLMAPSLVAQQTKMRPEQWLRRTQLGWHTSLEKPSSNLGMVESGGLLKLISLFKRVVLQSGTKNPVNHDARHNEQWLLKRNNIPISNMEKAELCAGIIKAMGISHRLARVVLLTGHKSQTCNNHTASSLDCGACGGQTGELNVKILSELLNNRTVRALMPNYGVTIPHDTHFYASLHNTTTDDIQVFNTSDERWLKWVNDACQIARNTRAKGFNISEIPNSGLKKFFKHRATNWAQMRPEWGLCNNAAAFIAPRELTRNIDFSGRAFLHEYDVNQDCEFRQLERIMTAPLLVMNWINLQYYASVTVPDKYGSGNKLLHNVVGGHIGVFEGNGGDLRIGLSSQSVYDGKQYRHQPVRLSTFIQAPREAIEAILIRNSDVASLVNNGWLFLYQIDEQHMVWHYHKQTWICQ